MRNLTNDEKNAMVTISTNFLSASSKVGTTRRYWNQTADALIRMDLDDAIVKAECALEALKDLAKKFE